MITKSTLLKLLVAIAMFVAFTNFANAQVIDYDAPKEKNWWLMVRGGNAEYNFHHGLYTVKWGRDVETTTRVKGLYWGVSYGHVFRTRFGREINLDIGYTNLGGIKFFVRHPDYKVEEWGYNEEVTIDATEMSVLSYYGKISHGKPFMLRLGYAWPEAETHIYDLAADAPAPDNTFYSTPGALLGVGVRIGNFVAEYKLYMVSFGSKSQLFDPHVVDFNNGINVFSFGYRF